MDAPDCDRRALREALEALAQVNRLLGGERLVGRALLALLRNLRPGPLRILDVGCGGGDVTAGLVPRLAERGWSPSFVLGDLHQITLEIARDRIPARSPAGVETGFVRLDGSRLPFADRSFDVALSSTTLHHLEREEAVSFLSELSRISRLGWIVTDLRRSRALLLATRLLAGTVWRRRAFPRVDGPISARRAFTPGEVRELLERAGAPARVEGTPFRLVVCGGPIAQIVDRDRGEDAGGARRALDSVSETS